MKGALFELVFDQPLGLFGAYLFQRFKFLSLQLIVIDKEFLEVVGDLFGQVVHLVDVLEDVRAFGDGQEPVVTDQLLTPFFLGLFGFYAADDAAFDDDAGKAVEFGDHDDVQGIAVLSFGFWDEPEIIGKDHAGGQDLAEPEKRRVGYVVIFLGAAFRGLDDDIYAV